MLPRISLLEELRKGGYETSLITTFNAYLPFYEEVVLRRLVNAGVRHNVLLMDAQQYSASLANHPPRSAGRRYTLIPVRVPGAFHPKLIFLAGKHKGLVVVGSHNMTLAGFGFNRELTNVVRIQGENDPAGIAVAREVWAEVEHWLAEFTDAVPKQVVGMARRVLDFAPWMNNSAEPSADIKLLSGRPGHATLWAQLLALIDGATDDVVISGAFFDEDLRFLETAKRDLQPRRLTVGIDPNTVAIPAKARLLKGISMVQANRLGVDSDNEDGGTGYLHAKGISLRQTNGGAIFAAGSANPSSPAWLASETSGNVELMLARRGPQAVVAAEALGFNRLVDMPALDDADWSTIERNRDQRIDSLPATHAVGLGVVGDGRVTFDRQLLDGLEDVVFVLLNANREEIARTNRNNFERDLTVIDFTPAQLDEASLLHCILNDSLRLELLLHHARLVEDQARTGVQRRFKEALLSLETNTPDIGLLIQCIDKIVFAESTATASITLREAASREKPEVEEPKDLGSLAIDVRDIKKRSVKSRLRHSADFAYLLDALIYHLRIQEDKSLEDLDRYGRSEEEQVGSDDDEAVPPETLSTEEQGKLIELCHSKVRTLVNRIAAQFKAYLEGKQPLDAVLIRLLGVLAVIRELRACDGRAAWVEKGTTTVPKELRLRLLEEAMLTLFEGKSSLLDLEQLGEDFKHSDDVARLKGLLLWLAWDCGLTLNLRKPFMESPDDLAERLRRNAKVLALAQMVGSEDIVIEEARQSIGSLTAGEMVWLKHIQGVAAQCTSLQNGGSRRAAEDAQPGDIAIHKTAKDWSLRLVASSNGQRVALVRLAKDKDRVSYTTQSLAVARFTPPAL